MGALGASLLGLAFIVTWASPALAHEDRRVGRFHFAVGFGDEPAYAGDKNSVQLLLHTEKGDKPVTDLTNSLKVQVSYQSLKMPPITLEPNFEIGEFGIPGDYRGWFIPTRPGTYSFHFTGSIHGQRVNETFKSGPTTFSDVEDPQSVQFPAKDPTTGQLNQLVSRQNQRLQHSIASARSDVSGDASLARNIAIAALILALIAIAASVVRRTR
jgi:hypothetical protein